MARVIPSGDLYHARPNECDLGTMMESVSRVDAISKSEAERRGMEPCSECFPDE